jgi:hypothetical protein
MLKIKKKKQIKKYLKHAWINAILPTVIVENIHFKLYTFYYIPLKILLVDNWLKK